MDKNVLYKDFPESPGVYIMKNATGEILYIGKAGNLKRRVSSYFLRPHDSRIQKMVSQIVKIEYKQTDTALEALILEATLIKKHEPPFNVKDKDDRSFLYAEITKEEFPRVLLVRGKSVSGGKRYGPFTSAGSIREALRIIRRIFPWSTHDPERLGKFSRACFDYELGLCPGTCIGKITKSDYRKNIGRIELLFQGKKKQIIAGLEKEMKLASRQTEFEVAEKLKRRIFALRHIQDVALLGDEHAEGGDIGDLKFRIEGYDISNISGTSAVGAMVVFTGGTRNLNEYRKFKIGMFDTPNDVGMLQEMLMRRFRHGPKTGGWPLPHLILIDGGKGQVNAAERVLREVGLRIPVVGIAKGPTRKKNEFVGKIPEGVNEGILIKVRNEAHRFAISYHRAVRGRRSFG